jgi:branched-chain amino acid transport system substrate-binding protein
MFQPFSGPDAPFGPEMQAGCVPAAFAINKAGGVLGHQITCKTSDNRGDPADAVPAAEQLIAATSNLVGVLGPDSNTASATVPLFNRAHIPMFTDTGQSVFDQNDFGYYWRILPPDAATGYAMALFAYQKGYRTAAAIFGTDISAQGSEGSVIKGFEALGGKIVLNQAIAEGQSSYRSEVAALAAAKPQVIFTEADPQTSATYYSELKQQSHLIPIIGTDGTTQPAWTGPVSKAVGAALFAKYYVGAEAYAPTTGSAYSNFKTAVLATGSQLAKPIAPWLSDSYSMSNWDGINIMCLAMLQAKSVNPQVYNSDILKVVAESAGAVVVHSFAEGKQALAAGKKIQYIGASGPVVFDKWHNSPGDFEVVASNLTSIVTSFTGAQIAAVEGKARS